MNYTVAWKPSAENELAAIWNAAVDKNAVTRAAGAVDDLLRRDPPGQGESRSGQDRVILRKPLGVEYRVSESQQAVIVLRVWRYR
jgi:plasmid stabilization system protein ParE